MLVLSVLLLASCGGDSGAITTGADTTAADTTAADTTTAAPVLEVGEMEVEFTPGDFSGTLTWGAVEGATSYDIYMGDTAETLELIGEGITELTYTFHMDWGTSSFLSVAAHGEWLGNDAIIAESGAEEYKTNGIRANDFAVHDDTFNYHVPQMYHAAAGILWINGEVWVCDGGNRNDTFTTEYLLELRKEFLGDKYEQYAEDTSCKLAINIYITHYHIDHIGTLMNSIYKNDYIVAEDIYTPEFESVEERRPPELAEYLQKYTEYEARVGSRHHAVPFGEHIQIEFKNSSATLDLYAAIIDWSIEVYLDNGTKNIRTGWWYMYAMKEASAKTLAQNCNSMWGKFTYGESSILFTGDTYDNNANVITPMLEYYGIENFDVDILIYLHHGHTRYSTALYDAATPTATIFTCSLSDYDTSKLTRNSIKYAKSIGSDVYWTLHGAFTFTLNGTSITCDNEPTYPAN